MRLETIHLTRRFGGVTALEGVSAAFESGIITGLVGPNGAGKSTMLRLLAGRDVPDCGEILCGGIPLCDEPEKCLPCIGFMPDALDGSRNTAVLDHLDLALRLKGIRSPVRKGKLDEVIALTGIGRLADQMISALSKGERQRVSLARLLLQDADFLLLDEPAAGLDPRARTELRDILRQQAEAGKGILISSHILSELSELCSRTIILEKGRIAADTAKKNEKSPSLLLASALPPAELRDLLLRRPEVHSAEIFGCRVRAELCSGDPARFAAGLISDGVPVTGFELDCRDLEAMYLETVGRGDPE